MILEFAFIIGIVALSFREANMPDTVPAQQTRKARAERYFTDDLNDQRQWYSRRAARNRSRSELLAILIIAAGAATSFTQIFNDPVWVPTLTAALGAFVVMAEGWQRISRYGDTWLSYRIASERMKREQRLYQNGAGAYRNLDDDIAYLQFIETIENILSAEQQIFNRARASTQNLTNSPTTNAES
jgi:hypothetical protein